MQGVNEKQRQDHRDELAARDREVADLRTRVAQLEQGTGGTGAVDKLDLTTFFDKDTIERFGEDQCEVMARTALKAASEQARKIVDAELKPIKDAKANDDAAKAKKAEDAFWSQLDTLIAANPDAGNRTIWEINEEEGFKAWLRESDGNGETHQAKLTRFQRTLNAKGVANVFGDYLSKSKAPAPPAPPVAPGSGAGHGGEQVPNAGQTVNGKGYPSAVEFADYTKRAATIRNPRDPRYVTKEDRQEMEARLRLPRPPGR